MLFTILTITTVLCINAYGSGEEWQFDDGYNTWTVTINRKVDYENVEKTRNKIDVRVEIATYGQDWCKLVLSDTGTTDWGKVRRWVSSL